jgi:hypothetical protein
MSASSRPGTMDAYKPRRTPENPATTAKITEAKQEAQDAKDRAKISAMGYKNGGMVKMTKKATPYVCGGMVKK